MLWISVSSGKFVRSGFSETVPVGRIRTEPVRGEHVLIGIDTSGLHAGAVFGQPQAGTLVVLDEAYGEDVAFEASVRGVLLPPLMAKRYHGCRLLVICDRSNPRDARTGVTPVQLLQRYQIRAQPAVTNTFKLRKDAVAWLLSRRSGVVIDPVCDMLIDGLGKSYVYRKLRATSTAAWPAPMNPKKAGRATWSMAFSTSARTWRAWPWMTRGRPWRGAGG
jgi:hypothetical protein